MSTASSDILLQAWRQDGDERAKEQLVALFYPWLTRAAAGLLRGERNVSLSAGDLVQEAFVRLVQLERIDWRDRAHFMALASRVMRRVLVGHVRAKQAGKRDHKRVTLTTLAEPRARVDLQVLDHALLRLSALNPEYADIVEMRYFGGMNVADVAEVTGLSEPTVRRRWSAARAWLLTALRNDLDG